MAQENVGFDITALETRVRLDKFLVERLSKDLSRAYIQKLIQDGNVLVDGAAVKVHHKLRAHEHVAVTIPRAVESIMKPEKIPLNIVYEDKHLLVVNKSGDMVVHPAPGNWTGTLANALLAHCKDLSGIGGVMKPGLVHRIDKGTSGLLVVAKTDEAHRFLAKQFKAKTARRVYIAIVNGVVQLDNNIVELPIGRSARDRKKMAVNFVDSKEATTRYHVLERFKDSTLLELALGTGRTHQIRVHMSYIGHPLLGDVKYGARHGEVPRPMLHAKTIGFMHPVTEEYMEFTSELPADMKKMIRQKRAEGKT